MRVRAQDEAAAGHGADGANTSSRDSDRTFCAPQVLHPKERSPCLLKFVEAIHHCLARVGARNGVSVAAVGAPEARGTAGSARRLHVLPLSHRDRPASEKDAKLAQKLGQLQPFIAVFQQECILGQRASFRPT